MTCSNIAGYAYLDQRNLLTENRQSLLVLPVAQLLLFIDNIDSYSLLDLVL